MKFFDLADELEYSDLQDNLRAFEATTMDAVSFIPAHMGVVKSKVKGLAKQKQKWNLEILEDDEGNRDVRIEDALRIIVPEKHWKAFQEMFSDELNSGVELNLMYLLNEAMEDDLKDLRNDLKPALLEMYNEQRFGSLDKTIRVWRGRFGINRTVTDKRNVVVTSERKGRDIQKLHGNLLRAYNEDRGGLEMLIDDMASSRPLSAHEVFKKYNYLYGSRVVSTFYGITLIFEAAIDTAFMTSESIYISDEDVLDEIEDQLTSVKRVGDVLFPTNDKFDVSFFGSLYDIIEETVEEMEAAEEEEPQVEKPKPKKEPEEPVREPEEDKI